MAVRRMEIGSCESKELCLGGDQGTVGAKGESSKPSATFMGL